VSAASKPVAWVTGAGGLIGQQIIQAASETELPWQPRGLQRSDLDLLDWRSMDVLFKKEKPAIIIHCAAMSRSPDCEANPKLAHESNVEVTRRLADLGAPNPFLFFSTDLVFDGEKGNYSEGDKPNPLQVYGKTKLAAEQAIAGHPQHIILRISLTGGRSRTGDRGFNEEMENAWKAGRTLNLFTDEYRAPMPAIVPARAVWELLKNGANGIYHLNGSEKLSRYEIGKLLAARHPELNPTIKAGTRREYNGPPRPADTSMNIAKIQKVLSFRIPGLTEWLRDNPAAEF
jgi:dTDP-4-dehydrorhamnose reductase